MRSVLISIRPEWCEKILRGEKTVEVRKTRPKVELPVKCYIYCTSGYMSYKTPNGMICHMCGGKSVVGEFMCDEIYKIDGHTAMPMILANQACLSPREMHEYIGPKTGYAWNISNLKIYNIPRNLREFNGLRETKFGWSPMLITRPPQSWRYVEEELWND